MAAHGIEEELLNVTDIAELLADNEFLEEDVEAVAAALAKGAELKAYSQEVEGELKEVETASIEAYIREDENLKNLHKDIRSCDGEHPWRRAAACHSASLRRARATAPSTAAHPRRPCAQRSWHAWSICSADSIATCPPSRRRFATCRRSRAP